MTNDFYIHHCMLGVDLKNLPKEPLKTWTLVKTLHSIELFCNGVHLITFTFKDSLKAPSKACIPIMSLRHTKIQFNELTDLSSENYLAPPSCTSLPSSWKGVRIIPSLPAPYGSILDVCCENGFYKASGDYKIKCHGENRFLFLDQPICRKICDY